MGVRTPTVASTTLATAVLGQNAETICITSPPLSFTVDFEQLLIFWYCLFIAGASATAVAARLRRGATVSGLQLNIGGSVNISTAATAFHSGCYIDSPGPSAGIQYSFSLSTTGATATGTISDAGIIVVGL